MAYQTLTLEQDAELALLTLNRPEKLNALTHEMMDEFHAALREVEAGAARVLIVTGAGKAFCAGMDLSVLKQMSSAPSEPSGSLNLLQNATPDPKVLADSRRIVALFRHIYTFSKPMIAAVNGHAVAGGCGIATLADITLAAPEAKFGYTEVRVGFMPAFVAAFLIRQIGEKRARDLLLTGRIIEAEEARQIGLVNEIVGGGKLLDRAREIAAQMIAVSPTSLRYTKGLIGNFFQNELDRELEMAMQMSARLRATRDFHEGLSAFLEKRKPRWQDL
ncbi:MAG TPA: enoyl-CoA hydratase/isomerase family protein [Terriglobia bacterium]|nr:enoyl-CoA hydratase/isomerase family protein [Terriglobia bacterium]